MLRRRRGCWIFWNYREECNELGYWTDSAVVEPAQEDLEESEEPAGEEEVIPTDGAIKVLYMSAGSIGLSVYYFSHFGYNSTEYEGDIVQLRTYDGNPIMR
jgi:hypothetical protein